MRLVIEIELGNSAMRTKAQLLQALLKVRKAMNREMNLRDKRYGANRGSVLDVNGNTVGKWEVQS